MRDRRITLLCWVLARFFDFLSLCRKSLPILRPTIGRYHKGQAVAPDARLVRRTATGVPGNIVIIKPCCLGDVVLSSAAVADLHAAFPNAFISYVVSDWARPAVAHNPRIDTVVRWDGSPQRDKGTAGKKTGAVDRKPIREERVEKIGRIWARLGEYRAQVRMLRNGRYDCAIVLDRSPRIGLLAWLAGVPVRVGVDSGHRGFAHTLRVPLLPTPEHEVDLYCRVVTELVARYSGSRSYGHGKAPKDSSPTRLEFYPSTAATQEAVAVLARLNPQGRPVVIVHPGGGVNPANAVLAKRWPAERFAAIIARLFEDTRPLILITGNAADDDDVARLLTELARLQPTLCHMFLADADTRTDVVSCIAAFDIDTLGGLCGYATLFVGNDTGLMHIATAQGAGVVAVFGPSDPRMYGPYHPSYGGWVAPATNAHWGRRLEEYRDMSVAMGGITAVTVDAVWAKIAQCLPLRVR